MSVAIGTLWQIQNQIDIHKSISDRTENGLSFDYSMFSGCLFMWLLIGMGNNCSGKVNRNQLRKLSAEKKTTTTLCHLNGESVCKTAKRI